MRYIIHYDYLGYEECYSLEDVLATVKNILLDGGYRIVIEEGEEE